MFSSSNLFLNLIIAIGCRQSVMGQAASGSYASPAPTTPSAPATADANSGSSVATLAAGLSSNCQTAAGSLITSDFGTCSNIIGLVSVVGASGSVVTPLNNWITGVCSASPCSNATLTSASQTINSACAPDAQKGSAVAGALVNVVANYNPVRDFLCAQYSSNSTFCVPFLLGSVQNATGINITVSQVVSLVSGGVSNAAASPFANVPSSAYCNDCGHALVTQSGALTAASNLGPISSGTNASSTGFSGSVAGVCGASFSDGKLPSTIKIANKGSSGNAKNAAGVERASLKNVGLVALISTTVFLVL